MDTHELDFAVHLIFALSFILIVGAGIALSVSTYWAIALLFAAFVNNAIGYGIVVLRHLLVKD